MADSSYVPAGGGTASFGLPAPQVRLAQNNNGVPVQVSNDNPGLLQTPIDIAPENLIQVVVQDIPEAVFSSGPLSPIITVGQAVHPFIDEWIDWGDGPHKAATLNPSSSENIGKAWIGERRQNDV